MVFDFLKKLFRKEESLPELEEPVKDFTQSNQTAGFEQQYNISFSQPTLSPQAFLTQNMTPLQNQNEIELIKQQIIVLNTKLDLINSKIDHLIQKIQLLENYLFYRR